MSPPSPENVHDGDDAVPDWRDIDLDMDFFDLDGLDNEQSVMDITSNAPSKSVVSHATSVDRPTSASASSPTSPIDLTSASISSNIVENDEQLQLPSPALFPPSIQISYPSPPRSSSLSLSLGLDFEDSHSVAATAELDLEFPFRFDLLDADYWRELPTAPDHFFFAPEPEAEAEAEAEPIAPSAGPGADAWTPPPTATRDSALGLQLGTCCCEEELSDDDEVAPSAAARLRGSRPLSSLANGTFAFSQDRDGELDMKKKSLRACSSITCVHGEHGMRQRQPRRLQLRRPYFADRAGDTVASNSVGAASPAQLLPQQPQQPRSQSQPTSQLESQPQDSSSPREGFAARSGAQTLDEKLRERRAAMGLRVLTDCSNSLNSPSNPPSNSAKGASNSEKAAGADGGDAKPEPESSRTRSACQGDSNASNVRPSGFSQAPLSPVSPVIMRVGGRRPKDSSLDGRASFTISLVPDAPLNLAGPPRAGAGPAAGDINADVGGANSDTPPTHATSIRTSYESAELFEQGPGLVLAPASPSSSSPRVPRLDLDSSVPPPPLRDFDNFDSTRPPSDITNMPTPPPPLPSRQRKRSSPRTRKTAKPKAGGSDASRTDSSGRMYITATTQDQTTHARVSAATEKNDHVLPLDFEFSPDSDAGATIDPSLVRIDIGTIDPSTSSAVLSILSGSAFALDSTALLANSSDLSSATSAPAAATAAARPARRAVKRRRILYSSAERVLPLASVSTTGGGGGRSIVMTRQSYPEPDNSDSDGESDGDEYQNVGPGGQHDANPSFSPRSPELGVGLGLGIRQSGDASEATGADGGQRPRRHSNRTRGSQPDARHDPSDASGNTTGGAGEGSSSLRSHSTSRTRDARTRASPLNRTNPSTRRGSSARRGGATSPSMASLSAGTGMGQSNSGGSFQGYGYGHDQHQHQQQQQGNWGANSSRRSSEYPTSSAGSQSYSHSPSAYAHHDSSQQGSTSSYPMGAHEYHAQHQYRRRPTRDEEDEDVGMSDDDEASDEDVRGSGTGRSSAQWRGRGGSGRYGHSGTGVPPSESYEFPSNSPTEYYTPQSSRTYASSSSAAAPGAGATSMPLTAQNSSGSGGGGGAGGSASGTKKRGNLPREVTELLKSWILAHSENPYPTDEEKKALCAQTGLSYTQVSNWMINARRRVLPPENKHKYQRPSAASSSRPSTSSGVSPTQQAGPSTRYGRARYDSGPSAPDPSPYAESSFGGRHAVGHLPPLALPIPGSQDPLPQLDRRRPSLGNTSSVTLPPLQWTPDQQSQRRSTRTSSSVAPPGSSSSPAYWTPQDEAYPTQRSASTRPQPFSASGEFAYPGPRDRSPTMQRSYTPGPGSSQPRMPPSSSRYAAVPARMSSPAPRSRTPGPGSSQPQRSRGVLSIEELAAYGYTPAQAEYVARHHPSSPDSSNRDRT